MNENKLEILMQNNMSSLSVVALKKDEVIDTHTAEENAAIYVLEGKIFRGKTAKLIRNGQEIFVGQIDQLKRFKDDVKEVAQGFECGISFAKFNDIQEGDIIEVSTTEEVAREEL